MEDTTITIDACGKINLGLDVVRKREDGYHELDMVMQTVGLYDTLTFTKVEEKKIVLTSKSRGIPVDQRNLVYKAAQLMMDTYGLEGGIHIDIKKRIPVAAGMAGGSSDCAATIKAMNQLWNLNLSVEDMQHIGVKLGADVPYCIIGGTARAQGIGDILTPLPDAPWCYILLVKPPIRVSTRFVYGNLRANELTQHPDMNGVVAAIEEGNVFKMAKKIENVLETVTIPAHPEIAEIKTRLQQLGAIKALMSGSGPTVFGVFTNGRKARQACMQLREEIPSHLVFLTRAVGEDKRR